MGGKRLNLLHDLLPQAATVAFLSRPNDDEKNKLLAAARELGRELVLLEIRGVRDYEVAFTTLVQRQAKGLVVGATPLNDNKILELAAHYRIPTIYQRREQVEAGGLMSYGADYGDVFPSRHVYRPDSEGREAQ
jgi:putative ABC transport system substrate-binding protein